MHGGGKANRRVRRHQFHDGRILHQDMEPQLWSDNDWAHMIAQQRCSTLDELLLSLGKWNSGMLELPPEGCNTLVSLEWNAAEFEETST